MRLTAEDTAVAAACSLLNELSAEELREALVFFGAQAEEYRKGEFLLRAGDPVRRFGLLVSGAVQVCSDDISGYRMIMASVTPGVLFGEALCFLRVEQAPIYILATCPSRVIWMRTDPLLAPARDEAASRLQSKYIAMLSRKLLDMNDRIQVLSRQLLRDKLTTYFSQCALRARSRDFTIPFDRESLAAYLGVNRSALSRELSRMQREGLIRYEKNRFTLLE